MRLPAVLILLCTIAFPTSAATPFWGAKASDAVDVAPPDLELGHFVWLPQAAPAGPIVVVVGLDDQIAYAYRNGVRIGYAKVSTGKKGHETPTGVFTTLPTAFRANVTPLLVPGTTLMVTDAAVLPSTTGVPMTVVTNAAP